MYNLQKWKVFEILGKPYVLAIIESLLKSPKRYSDLSEACPNDKTRTNRLRELEKEGFITTLTQKIKDRTYIHYTLTKKGKQIIENLIKIQSLLII